MGTADLLVGPLAPDLEGGALRPFADKTAVTPGRSLDGSFGGAPAEGPGLWLGFISVIRVQTSLGHITSKSLRG